jgi:hypothetical protein
VNDTSNRLDLKPFGIRQRVYCKHNGTQGLIESIDNEDATVVQNSSQLQARYSVRWDTGGVGKACHGDLVLIFRKTTMHASEDLVQIGEIKYVCTVVDPLAKRNPIDNPLEIFDNYGRPWVCRESKEEWQPRYDSEGRKPDAPID